MKPSGSWKGVCKLVPVVEADVADVVPRSGTLSLLGGRREDGNGNCSWKAGLLLVEERRDC